MNNPFNEEHLRREIDIYLSSIENEDTDFKLLIAKAKELANKINNSKNPETVLYILKKYYNTTLLSPLTLNEDEFSFTGKGIGVNIRCDDIIRTKDFNIVYLRAYIVDIRHFYNSNTNEEEPVFPDYIDIETKIAPKLWLTKGGNIYGEYVKECILKANTIVKGNYIPHPPINIPCSVILKNNNYIFTVDIREPKLKALKEFYDVIIEKDKDYPKFDIRKFKKLKK